MTHAGMTLFTFSHGGNWNQQEGRVHLMQKMVLWSDLSFKCGWVQL